MRAARSGLTRDSTVAHIARAALESIAYQSAALLQAMGRDLASDDKSGGERTAPRGVSELRVDGGACVINLLTQFRADLLGIRRCARRSSRRPRSARPISRA